MSTSEEPKPPTPTESFLPVAKRFKTDSPAAVAARNNKFLTDQVRSSPSFVEAFFGLDNKLKFRCVTKTSKQTTKWVLESNDKGTSDGNFLLFGTVVAARFAFNGEPDKVITAEDRFGASNKVELQLSLPHSSQTKVPGVDDFDELVSASRAAMLRSVRLAVRDLIVPLLRKVAEAYDKAAKKADKQAVLNSVIGIEPGMMKDMVSTIQDTADDGAAADLFMANRYFLKSCGSNHHVADGELPDDERLIIRSRRTLYENNLKPRVEDEGKWRSQVFNIMQPTRKAVPLANPAKEGSWPGFHENASGRDDAGLARMTMKVTACNGWIVGFEPSEWAQLSAGGASGSASSLFSMSQDTPVYE